MSIDNQKAGMLMMIFSAVLFSFKPVFAKLAYRYGVAPQVLLGMRMLIAVPLFWVFCMFTTSDEKVSISKKDVLFFTLAGFFGFFAAAESGFFSLKYIDVSVSTMIIYTYPSMVAILSYFILGESIGIRKGLALVMVFAGTSAVLNIFDLSHTGMSFAGSLPENISPLGAALSFCAAFFFSLYYILQRLLSKKMSSIRLTTYLITAGGIFVIAAWHGADISQPYEVWLYAFGIAVLGTLFPFLLLGEGIKRVGASNAAIYSAIGPVSTITFSSILLGERLNPVQFIGAFFIVSGIIILGKSVSRRDI
jgi:drug/metabolite transporter (DMT)-like permease